MSIWYKYFVTRFQLNRSYTIIIQSTLFPFSYSRPLCVYENVQPIWFVTIASVDNGRYNRTNSSYISPREYFIYVKAEFSKTDGKENLHPLTYYQYIPSSYYIWWMIVDRFIYICTIRKYIISIVLKRKQFHLMLYN